MAVAFLCVAGPSEALSPNKAISQYIRDQWDSGQGFPGGPVNAFAQTPDGYLWIGTGKGLVRFDGFSFVLIERTDASSAPFGPVLGLAVDGKGNLWIRLQGPNLLRYHDGTFQTVTPHTTEAEEDVTAMCVGTNGQLLVSGLRNGVVQESNGRFASWAVRSGLPGIIISMTQTADGKVWIGAREQGLHYLSQGNVSAFPEELPDRKINALLEAPSQELWIGTDSGLVRWDGKIESGIYKPLAHAQIVAMTNDRDANVWVGSSSGLARIDAHGGLSMETEEDHSAISVTALFEDREGNLWVGTTRGVERFRDSAFTTYSVSRGLPSDSNGPVFADSEGRIWFGPNEGGLYWLQDGRVGRVTTSLPADVVYSIDGRKGSLWIGQRRALTHLRNIAGDWHPDETYTVADGLPQSGAYAVREARDGTIWVGTINAGLAKLRDGRFTIYTTASGLSSNAITAILEGSDGTIWVGTSNGLNALAPQGQWRRYTGQDGLPPGGVNCFLEDGTGVLWIGTDNGLAFLKSGTGTIQVPTQVPESLREETFGIAEDGTGSLWIATRKHILQVERAKLMRDVVANSDVREYGLGDGLLAADAIKRERSVVKDALGRIWVSTSRGLSFVDPMSASLNSVPALVHVEGIWADGRRIPVGPEIRVAAPHQRVTIAYTGLSLSLPGRVRFMYKLDEFDQRWTDATTAREAIYTNLEPGHYQFHVIASNSEGVWNSAEATIPFEIEPTVWKSWWFQLTSILLIASAVLLFFRLRILRITRQMKLRFEERLAERTRIAQELHDTLLQGVISASMQLHVVNDQIPADSSAKPGLNRILGLMGRVTEEGRNAVGGLRTGQNTPLELGQAFSEVWEEFEGQEKIDFHVMVEGTPRTLHPIIRDEIYSIGREALTNAFRHAKARSIEVELEYAAAGLRVLIRDSGIGFDSQVLRFGREGHWGLSGMRERAKRIGARLRVLSRPAAGTEVEVTIPGEIAFIPVASQGVSKWLSKFLRNWKHIIGRSTSEFER